MQETGFIDQNKDKWREVESLLSSAQRDPNRVTDLFVQASDDLSYARTNYPNRSVRVYLNGLAQQIYQRIYAKRTNKRGAFVAFWQDELPKVLWMYRRYLLYSLLAFLLGLGIGVLSGVYYPDFARVMLGDQYVAMTEANIAEGDPMAVYKSARPIEMFATIAINNIRVSFMVFVFGITFGVVTYYMLVYNGIVLGAFIYFFIQRMLFKEAFLAVMLHGTLELSMIVLAGSAGLILSKGMVFPGTYRRSEALIFTARAAMKVMIAVCVFLVVAAFIESFVTRITTLEGVANGKMIMDVVRTVLIFLSFVLVIGYFVWYPRKKFARTGRLTEDSEELGDTVERRIDIASIKPNSQVFVEAYTLFAKYAKSIAFSSLVFSALATLAYGYFVDGEFDELYKVPKSNTAWYENLFWVWGNFDGPLNFEKFPWMWPILVLLVAAWFQFGGYLLRRHLQLEVTRSFTSGAMVSMAAGALLGLAFLLPQWATFLLMPIVFPFAVFLYATFCLQSHATEFPLSDLFRQILAQVVPIVFLYFTLLALQWLGFFITDSQLVAQLIEIINLNVSGYADWSDQLVYAIYTFVLFFSVPMILCTSFFAFSFQFFSLREIELAIGLRARIERITQRKKAYGLEKE